MRERFECRYCGERFRLMYHRRVHEAEDCSARTGHGRVEVDTEADRERHSAGGDDGAGE